jgi:hypothetical protein
MEILLDPAGRITYKIEAERILKEAGNVPDRLPGTPPVPAATIPCLTIHKQLLIRRS